MKNNNGSILQIEVNVTKIVKYVCITATLTVGTIFGEKCYRAHVESKSAE